MPLNNQNVYLEANTLEEMAVLLTQTLAEKTGFPVGDDGVIWFNDTHTLGIYAKANNTNNVSFFIRYHGKEQNINSSVGTSGYFIYNCSLQRTVCAFAIGSSLNVFLNAAVAKDDDGIIRLFYFNGSSNFSVYSPESVSIITANVPYAKNIEFFGVTLTRVPTFFTPRSYPELYYVAGSKETNWGYDGTILADGKLFKLVGYNASSAALAFPVVEGG